MFIAFLPVASALGTPPYFGAMVLALLSNLMGGLTHYQGRIQELQIGWAKFTLSTNIFWLG
ncbi:unnamed protein product [Prunus armeniaca]